MPHLAIQVKLARSISRERSSRLKRVIRRWAGSWSRDIGSPGGVGGRSSFSISGKISHGSYSRRSR